MNHAYKYILLLALILNQAAAGRLVTIAASYPLTGVTSSLGIAVRYGQLAYINRVNETNELNNFRIRLMARDDQYEPYFTRENMLRFVGDPNVLAIIGNVGSPTAVVSVPIARERKIFFLGTLSGARVLRKRPPDETVFNFRPSFRQEINVIVKKLRSDGKNLSKVGLFMQNDSFGISGLRGYIRALKNQSFTPEQIRQVPIGRYARNSNNVNTGIEQILEKDLEKDLEAFVIIATSSASVRFIQGMRKIYPNAEYYIMGVDATIMKGLCASDPGNCKKTLKNITTTEVTPPLNLDNLPLVQEYKRDMKRYFPTVGLGGVSLEGYISVRILGEALKHAKSNHVTRETIIELVEGLGDFDIGLGYKLNFSKTNHQASTKVWLVPLDEIDYISY